MIIAEIARVLDADVLCCEDRLDTDIHAAFGADLLSDALAYMDSETLLLTGMVNAHVIRTAEMLELRCIVFVRGKTVAEDILIRAREQNIVVMNTDKTLYQACGLLYAAGLPSCKKR